MYLSVCYGLISMFTNAEESDSEKTDELDQEIVNQLT